MDFVLALHTHLPYVLNHGRWPHGSDWLCEAVVDTYLPLVETLTALEHEGTPTPVTIGVTPVLANQLASGALERELAAFFDQRLEASREAPEQLRGTHDAHLVPLAQFWEQRLTRLRRFYESIGGDLVGTLRGLADRGRVELMTSAATHGFLPLLGAEASIRLQLDVGKREFRRLFGRDAAGVWLPECAYRPRGAWRPFDESNDGPYRRGIEEHLADFGYRYFFVDAHVARAGAPLGLYGKPGGRGWPEHVVNAWTPGDPRHSPYRAYRVSFEGDGHSVAAFVRDPRTSARIWSRHGGYPGEEWYLEFHKTRWPGGLKFWRVSAAGSDLGAKQPYEPQRAMSLAITHGRDFTELLGEIAARDASNDGQGVVVAPFDTELFGHWWFEGPEFLTSMWRSLRDADVRPVTASAHLAADHTPEGLALAAGSWGRDGNWSMWNGPPVQWTWPLLWRLERAFWELAPAAMASADARPVFAQAARSMLLAQASDWQFIISTGEAGDYAIKRLNGHLADANGLIDGIHQSLASGDWTALRSRADAMWARDTVFPDVLDSIRTAAQLP